jgi:hypothetical protein
MGGLIMEESYYDTAHSGNQYHHVMHHIETVAYSWLGPFFFLELGSLIEVDAAILTAVWWKVIIFFIALFIGQFLSASLAAKYVPGGFTWPEAAMIGFGMMGRAELFFVVLEICYVAHHIMTREIVCAFAFTAMLMNISVPICITLYKPYYVKWTDEELSSPRSPVPPSAHQLEEAMAATQQAPKVRQIGNRSQEKGHCVEGNEHNTYICSKCGREEQKAKDLDSIDFKIMDSEENEDASTEAATSMDTFSRAISQESDDNQVPSRASSKSRMALLPQVCGCMSVGDNAIMRSNSYGPSDGRFSS